MTTSLLGLTVVAAVLVAVLGAVAGGVLGAEVRAQDAADAAALAAAHATVGRDDPVRVARRAATAGGGRLVTCDCSGPEVHVVVAVDVTARAARRTGVVEVTAEARARLGWSAPASGAYARRTTPAVGETSGHAGR